MMLRVFNYNTLEKVWIILSFMHTALLILYSIIDVCMAVETELHIRVLRG